MASFDIVSEVDLQEVDNAVNQATREMGQRYDFKGSKCEIEWDKKGELILTGDDYKLSAVTDILQTKLIKRNISIKALKYGDIIDASGGLKKQTITLQMGIDKENGKKIIKIIKELKTKAQPQIMDEKVRVTGKKLDDLQEIIAELKSKDLEISLQFVNMRS